MEYLVVGLGNIGAEYASTRHNLGFMVLDAWAQASNVLFRTDRYGDIAEVSFKGRWFVLLKPSTYMNLSGNAVRYWMQKLHLPLENLIVISDDINLPFGTLRMRAGGSSGGHNGLEDISRKLESDQWTRIRMGIGNEFSRAGRWTMCWETCRKKKKSRSRSWLPALSRASRTFPPSGCRGR